MTVKVTVDLAVHRTLKRAAANDQRSLHSYIVRVLSMHAVEFAKQKA